MEMMTGLIGFGEAGRTFAQAGDWVAGCRVDDIKTDRPDSRVAKLADYAAAEKIAPQDPRVFGDRSALHARMGDAAKEKADWATANQLDKSLHIEDRIVFPEPPKPPERKKLTPQQQQDKLALVARVAAEVWG